VSRGIEKKLPTFAEVAFLEVHSSSSASEAVTRRGCGRRRGDGHHEGFSAGDDAAGRAPDRGGVEHPGMEAVRTAHMGFRETGFKGSEEPTDPEPAA